METITEMIMQIGVRYLVCSIFAWAFFFIVAEFYLFSNLGLDPVEIRAFRRFCVLVDDDKRSRLKIKVVVEMTLLWPYQIIKVTHELVKYMTKYLQTKSR